MDDRLEEIKKRNEDMRLELKDVASQEDLDWLISELEKCREENQLLNALFDMQQTRMKKVTKRWQQATGKKDVLPDLGVLLDWLMEKMS